jgi:adenosylhomocysteinase
MSDDVNDPLAWARDHTPVLGTLADEHRDRRPFDGYTVAVASHLEASTGILIETLHAAGAEVLFSPSEPQSTHGDVVAALDERDGIRAFAEAGMTDEQFEAAQHALLDAGPDLICDDGCELIAKAHADHPDLAREVIGGCEQTTAGVTRLEAMEDDGVLEFPVYGVNDTPMKRLFDNVHGTGESTLANLMITTNSIVAGETVVVAGYGHCGRGIARKARALGARTIVTEVDPRKALQAHVDGHRIATMDEAAPEGDLFVTATGNRDVIRREQFERMTSGAKVANSGHFDVEVVVEDLAEMAEDTSTPKEGITRYHLPDGRHVDLLTEGRLVNLTGPYSQGHPIEVMDTTFASMFVGLYDHLESDLAPGVYSVPDRLDRAVAERKLDSLGASTDSLTERQQAYYEEWEHPDSSF